jgi:branched-chain amino acid transport system substrate-binding protein
MSGHVRVLLTAILLGITGCGAKEEPEPVLLGQLAPLSGPGRLGGESARRGTLLAVEDARADDVRINGRRVAVVYAEGDSPDVARAELVRLVRVNGVVGVLTHSADEAFLRTAGEYKVPVVIAGEHVGPLDKGAVALGASPGERGRGLAGFAREKLSVARLGVLTDADDPVASALASAVARAWPRDKGTDHQEWVYTEKQGPEEAVRAAAASGPDAVIVAVPARELRKLVGLLREGGFKGQLLYGGPDVGPERLAREVPPGELVHLATSYVRAGLTEAGEEFARRYEKRFGEAPDLRAVGAYDAARLLIDVLHQAQSVEGEALIAALAGRESFDSLTGPVTWKEGQPRRRVFVVRVRDRKAELVQTVGGDR